MNSSALSVGPMTWAASRRFRLEKICANRLGRRVVLRGMTALRGNIGTSSGLFEAVICRELRPQLSLVSNNFLDSRYNFFGITGPRLRADGIVCELSGRSRDPEKLVVRSPEMETQRRGGASWTEKGLR